MKTVFKKVGGALVDILIVVLIVLSIIISISSITAKANNGVPDLFGYSPFTVQSDSMKPTLNKGDYILVEKCDSTTLEVGDVITYFTHIDGIDGRVPNTHRIVAVKNSNGVVHYQTQGDNHSEPDKEWIRSGAVIGQYHGMKIPVMGTVIDFLSTQLGFFLVILLPVLIFTVFQIYKLISVIMYNKKVDMLNAVNEAATDEVKEAIIAEYLAKQKEKENAQEDKND